MEQIQKLEQQVSNDRSTITSKDKEIEQLEKSIDDECKIKDREIDQLKKQIDEMSSDFAEMLKQTLGKMQERIELANVQFEGDEGN